MDSGNIEVGDIVRMEGYGEEPFLVAGVLAGWGVRIVDPRNVSGSSVTVKKEFLTKIERSADVSGGVISRPVVAANIGDVVSVTVTIPARVVKPVFVEGSDPATNHLEVSPLSGFLCTEGNFVVRETEIQAIIGSS